MSDSTSSSSATLTLGGTVITGTIVDYETADYTVFDGTTAYSASGSSILGVLLVEFAIPSDATSGNYVPQVLLNGAAVSLLPATVEIVEMTTTNPAPGSISALAAGIAFTLTINDALVAPTLVATDAAQTINGVVTADGGNAYTGVLTINVAGSYSLAVEVSGTAVTGYPQTITVEPVALNGAYCHQKEALPSTILAGA